MFFFFIDKQTLSRLFWIALLAMLLNGCGAHIYHRVERGETLYSIGWIYGHDYRQIASWNDIPAPYTLSPGQHLRVMPPSTYSGQNAVAPIQESRVTVRNGTIESGKIRSSRRVPAPVMESVKETTGVVDKSSDAQAQSNDGRGYEGQTVIAAAKKAVNKLFGQHSPYQQQLEWRWPVKARRILRTYSANDPARQGIDIAGNMGNAVYAAAAGRVVYAGSGLVRYGRLIIVKHNEKYLSAYAHNKKLHVKEGEVVKVGQRIAEMGRSGHLGEYFIRKTNDVIAKGNTANGKRAKLHFEIRRNGKPVDPARYLPK